MTGHALDERDHVEAVKATLTATLAPWSAYDFGKVPGLDKNPGDVPPIFVVLSVERTFTPATHASRTTLRTGWRINVVSVGRSANECRWASLRAAEALDSQRLLVDSRTTTPIQHETSEAPELNSGRFSSLTRWTYGI